MICSSARDTGPAFGRLIDFYAGKVLDFSCEMLGIWQVNFPLSQVLLFHFLKCLLQLLHRWLFYICNRMECFLFGIWNKKISKICLAFLNFRTKFWSNWQIHQMIRDLARIISNTVHENICKYIYLPALPLWLKSK